MEILSANNLQKHMRIKSDKDLKPFLPCPSSSLQWNKRKSLKFSLSVIRYLAVLTLQHWKVSYHRSKAYQHWIMRDSLVVCPNLDTNWDHHKRFSSLPIHWKKKSIGIFKPFTALNMPQPEEIVKFIVTRLDFLSITGHEMSPYALLNWS